MHERSLQQNLLKLLESGPSDKIRGAISAGANVNARGNDPDGETPLMRAASCGNAEGVQLLIEAGANVNSAGVLTGWTPLMYARPHLAVIKLLIEAGADVNARSAVFDMISPVTGKRVRRGGETALHLAAAANDADAVTLLLQAGAEIERRAENGLAALDYAVKLGSPTEAAVILIEAGAEVTPERFEALHSAAHDPHSDLWELPWTTAAAKHQPAPLSIEAEIEKPAAPLDERDRTTHAEVRCPYCKALLYSRRSRICGNCNAFLPSEYVPTDEQVDVKEQARKWARDLADAFSGHPHQIGIPSGAADGTPRNSSFTDLVRRSNQTAQFKTPLRPPVALYLSPALLLSLLTFKISGSLDLAGLIAVPLLLVGYAAWRRAK